MERTLSPLGRLSESVAMERFQGLKDGVWLEEELGARENKVEPKQNGHGI